MRARARVCVYWWQMREPSLALKDVQHVLRFDPTNEKALARKAVYEKQLAAEG